MTGAGGRSGIVTPQSPIKQAVSMSDSTEADPQSPNKSGGPSTGESSNASEAHRAADGTRDPALPSALAGALAFFASAAILVLEILGARILAPYVGVTLQTYTSIIGTVLAGISLGTWLGGKIADRIPPRSLISPLLVIGGGTVLMTVPTIRFFAAGVAYPSPPLVIALTFAGLFLPAAVLSAINPTLVKLQLSDLHETGSIVGRLSALATAGAIVGTFITGFLLVATISTSKILAALGAVLVVSGVVIHLMLRGVRREASTAVKVGVVIALVGFGSTVTDEGICDRESSYYCVRVIDDRERPTGRFVWLNDQLHGYSDVEDPTFIKFAYAKHLAAGIDVVRESKAPIEALSIGGGSFTLPRYIAATRPGTHNRVLEVDPVVVEIGEKRLGVEKSDQMRVRVGDARTSIRDEPDNHFDFVIGDAFGGEAVPWHLTTQEFLQELRRVMRDDGVYAMNIIDYEERGFVRAELRTLRTVFEHTMLVMDYDSAHRYGGNHVLFASPSPIDVSKFDKRLRELDPTARVYLGDELDRFVGDAKLLTDDFAPVDQLITPYQHLL